MALVKRGGLDDYEVRRAEGWHRHVTLALPAVVQATELDHPQHPKRVRGRTIWRPSNGRAA